MRDGTETNDVLFHCGRPQVDITLKTAFRPRGSFFNNAQWVARSKVLNTPCLTHNPSCNWRHLEICLKFVSFVAIQTVCFQSIVLEISYKAIVPDFSMVVSASGGWEVYLLEKVFGPHQTCIKHQTSGGIWRSTRWAPASYKWSYNPHKWPQIDG